MILHLIHDDKVVPRMIKLFEEYNPGKNIFICVSTKQKGRLKFIKNNSNVIMSYSKQALHLPWKNIDKICIHYLDIHKRFYLRLRGLFHNLKSKKIIWLMWGGDIYSYLEHKGFILYSKENSYYFIRKKEHSDIIESLFHRIISVLDYRTLEGFINNRVDYIAASIEEFKLFKKYVSFDNCKDLLSFSYYSIEDTLGELFGLSISGDSIMVGNSASATNNHEYVLKYLEQLDIGKTEVIVPMSYGVNRCYLDIIETKYCSSLANVVVLKEFLPLDDYHRILMKCSTFIYGNFRQEAWGNILMALYLGGKVYLCNCNPLSEYCKRLGFKIFDLEDIDSSFKICLSESERLKNREIALEYFSRKVNEVNIKLICNL